MAQKVMEFEQDFKELTKKNHEILVEREETEQKLGQIEKEREELLAFVEQHQDEVMEIKDSHEA